MGKAAAAKAKEAKEAKDDDEEEEQQLAEGLMDFSDLGRTADGTSFAYRSVSCMGKRIGPIKAIAPYIHLQSIDLSKNCIKDPAPLKGLPLVLRLKLADNSIPSLKAWESEEEPPFQHLVDLDISGNNLTALTPLPMKALKSANFARNDISTCADFGGHEKLESLDLSEQRQNKITSLAGVAAMPALTSLNASSNELADLNGLADLPLLQDLDLSGNKFQELEGPWPDLAELKTLRLANCQLAAPKPLEVLRNLPKLRTFEARGNPFYAEEGARPRTEVLICHWRLTTLDGQTVTEEELEEARLLNVEREEVRRRKQAEEEAAAAAAEEG